MSDAHNVGQTRHLPEFEVTPTEVMAPRARDGRKMRAIIIAAAADRRRTAVAFRRMMTGISVQLASLADGKVHLPVKERIE